jgi:hypothetical protein
MTDVAQCWQVSDCSFDRDGATDHIVNTTALLQEFFGERIAGHRDLQTLPRQTSFCGDFSKEEFIQTTRETWRNCNTIMNRLLPMLT